MTLAESSNYEHERDNPGNERNEAGPKNAKRRLPTARHLERVYGWREAEVRLCRLYQEVAAGNLTCEWDPETEQFWVLMPTSLPDAPVRRLSLLHWSLAIYPVLACRWNGKFHT